MNLLPASVLDLVLEYESIAKIEKIGSSIVAHSENKTKVDSANQKHHALNTVGILILVLKIWKKYLKWELRK